MLQQKIGDGECCEEDESTEFVYAGGEESVENCGGDQYEAEHRSPDAQRRSHGQGGNFLRSEPPAEAYMGRQGYDPGEDQAGECGSHDVEEGRSEEHTSELQSLRHLVC